MTQLQDTLVALAKARADLAQAKAKKDSLWLDVEISPIYGNYTAAAQVAAKAAAQVAALDADVRQQAIAEFRTYGGTAPADGCKIRLVKHIKFDMTKAIEWAEKHMPVLVKTVKVLDEKAFSKSAPLIEGSPITTETEIQATIDSDLSRLLPVPVAEATDVNA